MVRGITEVQGVEEMKKTLGPLLAMGAVGKVLTRSHSVALDPIRQLEVVARKVEELKAPIPFVL